MGGVAQADLPASERAAAGGRAAVVEHLREQIRRVQAAPRRYLATLSTRVAALDELGVFRLGAAVELSGEEASGRATVALSLVASACREQRLAAWVDGPQELYPPAAVPLGVELSRLLIVRPPGSGQLVWAAVQLLRSGAFACVVLDVTHTGLTLSQVDTRKLLEAARTGGGLLVVLTSSAAPAQGLVRLALSSPSSPEARLRLVTDDAPARAELHVELAKAQGGTGRRLVAPRPALTHSRARRTPLPGLALPRVLSVASLQRLKKNELRDGRGFVAVTRPGQQGSLGLDSAAPVGTRRRPASKLAALDAVRVRSFR